MFDSLNKKLQKLMENIGSAVFGVSPRRQASRISRVYYFNNELFVAISNSQQKFMYINNTSVLDEDYFDYWLPGDFPIQQCSTNNE